jgi:hypothetical protein|tara:strand:- start:1346 stop:1669 length:324 start_codon:yes stop_codon:yes gene_type:complete
MKTTHTKIINCSAITAEECSDNILAALGHGAAFKLKADTPDDTVHGSVCVTHHEHPTPHTIEIEVYEQDSFPSTLIVRGKPEGRRSTLKRPEVMPTQTSLQEKLDAI